MEDTVVTDGLEDLDHLPADVAARLSHMPIEHRATALTHLKRVADQLCGIYLDELHHLSLDTPPAVFNAVDHLHETNTVTRREATAQYKLAAELADRYPRIGAALRAGTMSLSQVQAVVRVLRHSPLGVDDMTRAQELLVDHADRFDPIDLAEMARRITELLDPDAAEEREAERLQREERLAQQERFLTVEPDHHGSMRIAGKVTPVVGATLLTQLDALMPSAATYKDAGPAPARAARRADALERLLGIAAATGNLPDNGGDRPRVIITLSYDTLLEGIGHATLTGTGEDITPARARSIACDAGIIPAVLGTASQPLDVGRESRTFPKHIRIALNRRDQGCAFPGCTISWASCDAHHIVPWWAGGRSRLTNGVLLCPHHHRVVEPDPNKAPEYQWLVIIDPEDGLPVLYPPVTIDPERKPTRHKKHQRPGKTLPPLPTTTPARSKQKQPSAGDVTPSGGPTLNRRTLLPPPPLPW